MAKVSDMKVGAKFGDLTLVSEEFEYNSRHHRIYQLRCDCGLVVTRNMRTLGNGSSCGTHISHWAYTLWKYAKDRCSRYLHYKNKGIEMYKPWRENSWMFCKWIEENLGPKPSAQHSLDRIDNNKGYMPGNLRWATNTEQNRNKSTNRAVTMIDKETNKVLQKFDYLVDAARAVGVDKGTISNACSGKYKTAGGYKWAYA